MEQDTVLFAVCRNGNPAACFHRDGNITGFQILPLHEIILPGGYPGPRQNIRSCIGSDFNRRFLFPVHNNGSPPRRRHNRGNGRGRHPNHHRKDRGPADHLAALPFPGGTQARGRFARRTNPRADINARRLFSSDKNSFRF
jgi:hypothetical protein